MAIAFVDASQASSAGAALSQIFTRPTNAASGNFAILVIGASTNNTTITPDAAWTQLFAPVTTGTTITMFTYYRVLDSTDTSGTTYTFSSVSRTWAGGISCYSGVNSVYNNTSSGPTSNTTATTTHSVAALTTTVNGCMILESVVVNAGTTAGSLTPSTSPAFNERIDSSATSAAQRPTGVADFLQTTSGLISPSTYASTVSGTDVSFSLALAPALIKPRMVMPPTLNQFY